MVSFAMSVVTKARDASLFRGCGGRIKTLVDASLPNSAKDCERSDYIRNNTVIT